MHLYPDEYIDHYGELFVKHHVRQRLHVSFEQFLAQPQQMLNRVAKIAGIEPTRAQRREALQDAMERAVPRAELHGGKLIEPVRRTSVEYRRPWWFRRRNHA